MNRILVIFQLVQIMVSKEYGQSLLDVCIQHTGTLETLFDLLELNSLDMMHAITSVYPLELPPVKNKEVVNYLNQNKIGLATDFIEE